MKVSVIMPVYDCRPSLERALRSVSAQSIGVDALEVVAVDDGSTDGSGEELDRWAARWPWLRVVHQPNSGGPGGPRNTGLEHATGEYVFFLDADDYLGDEALERMCAMADANGTDVVIGRYVGIGRKAPRFERDVARTTVLAADPPVYDSLSVLKLFRRSLIDRLELRFPAGLLAYEDQLFAARAYFGADGISVVGEYDCYYWVDREDGTSVLQQGGPTAGPHFACIAELMRYIAEQVPPGPDRDRLMARHFLNEIFSRFGRRYPGLDAAEQAATRDGARPLFEQWWTPGVAERFGARGRLIVHCVTEGLDDLLARVVACGMDGPPPEVLVEGARVFQLYPGFRDALPGTAVPDEQVPDEHVPDENYEITHRVRQRRRLDTVEWRGDRLRVRGHASLTEIGERDQSAELVLRERDGAMEFRVPFQAETMDGAFCDRASGDAELPCMVADIDLAGGGPLPAGRWDIVAVTKAGDLTREGPLSPAAEVEPPGSRILPVKSGAPYVTPYFTRGRGVLALHCGGLEGHPAPVTTFAAALVEGPALELTLEPRAAVPAEIAITAVLRRRGAETVTVTPLRTRHTDEGVRATGRIPLKGLAPGRWDVSYGIAAGGSADERRLPAPARPPVPGYGIEPYVTEKGNLSLVVSPRRRLPWRRRAQG
ncbi:glycosyltransferase family 2 protein [Actinomadura sp. 9N407]|uniref:glycosyltransferase family 2 protein n=1 Tax=Actinomadura sp. 9N407 TaxID=3375154 RepID=UPI0037AF8123